MLTTNREWPGWINWSVRRLSQHLTNDQKQALRIFLALWQHHWGVIFLFFLFSVISAFFEGSTFGILTVALNVLTVGDEGNLGSSLGVVGAFANRMHQSMGTGNFFILLVGLAVLSQFLRSALQFASELISVHMSTRLATDMTDQTFRQSMHISFAEVNRFKIGDILTYVNQSTSIVTFIQWLNNFLRQIFQVFAYVGVMLWISWQITIIIFPLLILLSLGLRTIVNRVHIISRKLIKLAVKFNEQTVEFIQAMRVVRTVAREDDAIEVVHTNLLERARYMRQSRVWESLVGPIIEITTIGGVAALLIGGYITMGIEGLRGIFAQASIFLLMLYRLIPRAGAINNSFVKFYKLLPTLERVIYFLRTDNKEYTPNGTQPFTGLQQEITFANLSFRYLEDGSWAIKDADITIPRGSMVALVGPSGAGKSTIADLLLRLYDPTEGQILVDGTDLREFDLKSWRQHIGVVSQDTFIFHANVRDNIAFAKPDATETEIIAAAQAANAHEFIMELSDGYETILGDRGYRLSGGQRQRIAIARAILRNPEILLLDEATSALDSQAERLIQQALDTLRGDRTIVAIAHRLSTIRMADQIIVLDRGHIIERGTHDELLQLDGRYADFWSLQAK